VEISVAEIRAALGDQESFCLEALHQHAAEDTHSRRFSRTSAEECRGVRSHLSMDDDLVMSFGQ
jgi:cyanate lyase